MEDQVEMWEGRQMTAVELEIGEEAAGERLDGWLSKSVPELSRSRAKALIEAGEVFVNGRRAKKSRLLKPGDRVTLGRLPRSIDFHAAADRDLDIEILLETEGYVVVDKPAGVPSHPLEEGEIGTLAGALVARYPEMRGVGYRNREPGILHRLDTDTSGLMLAARDRKTFDALRRQLHEGAIEKRYLARCVGNVSAPMLIDTPIANDPRDRRKVRACKDPREVKRLNARPASTEVLKSVPALHGSLVEVRANSARRHQIRVHLASVGHPLLGDTLYGGPRLGEPGHHLLHACSLSIGPGPPVISAWDHEDSEIFIEADER